MINDFVVEPIVVKTVSNKIESVEKSSLAEESEMILSFLQEKTGARKKNNKISWTIFFKCCKDNESGYIRLNIHFILTQTKYEHKFKHRSN